MSFMANKYGAYDIFHMTVIDRLILVTNEASGSQEYSLHLKLIQKFIFKGKKKELGYPELCHNQLDCFCFVLNLAGVEQN